MILLLIILILIIIPLWMLVLFEYLLIIGVYLKILNIIVKLLDINCFWDKEVKGLQFRNRIIFNRLINNINNKYWFKIL